MVAAYGSSSQTQRQSLYVNIDPYTYSLYEVRRSPQSNSPASSFSTNVSLDSTGTTSSSDAGTPFCVVLCMYDWTSDDPDHLNFTQNEILDVVKQEESGWWAAMRSDSEVGWIPRAFVERLSDDMAERLRKTPKQFRCKEYRAEQLYANPIYAPIYDPVEPLSPSPPSPWIHKRERDPFPPTKSTNPPRGHDPDSTYRLVLQRFPADQNASSQVQASRPYNSKQTQFASIDQESPHTRHRADTVPGSTIAPTATRRRDEPASATGSRPVYELNHPDAAFSRSRNAIEGLIKRNNSSLMTQAFLDEKPLPRGPWSFKPLYADQLEMDEIGQIRFGTLKALVEKLTLGKPHLESLQQRTEDDQFCNIFLMTFRTFMKSNELFEMLVEHYRMKDQPKDLSTAEFDEWKRHMIATQTRVLEVFNIWLTSHRLLQDDAHIAQKLTGFLELIKAPPLALASRLLEERIQHLTFNINSPTRILPKKTKKPKSQKTELFRHEAADIAEQLTLIESERYVKITPKECLLYKSKPMTSTNLAEFCSTHDKIVSWVKCSILTNEALGKRAATIEFWIKVAEKCKAMNNFASMSAIINALSSTVITRLHLTWAHVGRKTVLDGLLKHNEPTGGFAGYRSLLQNAEAPCVPFITMYLTDLVHIQDIFADEPGGRICFLQRQRSYEIVTTMLRFQSRPHDIAESENIMAIVKRSLQKDGERDNNWFWAKSQEVQQMELAHADIRKGLEAAGF